MSRSQLQRHGKVTPRTNTCQQQELGGMFCRSVPGHSSLTRYLGGFTCTPPTATPRALAEHPFAALAPFGSQVNALLTNCYVSLTQGILFCAWDISHCFFCLLNFTTRIPLSTPVVYTLPERSHPSLRGAEPRYNETKELGWSHQATCCRASNQKLVPPVWGLKTQPFPLES